MCKDYDFLNIALSINKADEITLFETIDMLIERLYFQTHHLSESLFLGNINDAEVSLNRIEILLGNLDARHSKGKLFQEYEYYRSLVDSWKEYTALDNELDFPSWCELKDKKYSFCTSYYYNK